MQSAPYILEVDEKPYQQPEATLVATNGSAESYKLGYEICALADAFGPNGAYTELSLEESGHPYRVLSDEPQKNIFKAYKFIHEIIYSSPDTIVGTTLARFSNQRIAASRHKFIEENFDIFDPFTFDIFLNLCGYSLPLNLTTYPELEGHTFENEWLIPSRPEIGGKLSFLSKKKNSQVHKVTKYYCNSILDVVVASMYHLVKANCRVKRCQHCNLLFIAQDGNERYCPRNSPEYAHKTCAQAAKYKHQRDRESIESNKMYRSINIMKTNKVNNAAKLGPDAVRAAEIERDTFRREAKEWKQKVRDGKVTDEHFKAWMLTHYKRKGKLNG